MSKRIKNIIGFLLLVAFFVLVLFTNNEQGKKLVKSVDVAIDATKGDPFLDDGDVMNVVYSRHDTLLSKPINALHLSDVEGLLKNQSSVK